MKYRILSWIIILFCTNSTIFVANMVIADIKNTVNIYSARQEKLIKPLLDQFSKKTNITVNLVTGKADALLTRLEAEGENSPADLLITTDAGRLYRAAQSKLLQCTYIPELEKRVPDAYRDPEHCWFALSLRARTIMVVKDKVKPNSISNYEELANKKWHNRICIRSSSNIYNQSLVASMLASNGKTKTQEWLKGLVNNFARHPTGGDRDQILAAAGGLCDVVIANTYYYAMMLESDNPQHRLAAEKIAITWPNQSNNGKSGRGTHINISGAAILRHGKNHDNARQLLLYLLSDEAQAWYAKVNHEYPVRKNIEVSKLLTSWGEFKSDSINLSRLGELNIEAVKLMDQSGWQ